MQRTHNTRWLVYLLAIALVLSGSTLLQATESTKLDPQRTTYYLKVKNSALCAKHAVRAACDSVKNKIKHLKNPLTPYSLLLGITVAPFMVVVAAAGARHLPTVKSDSNVQSRGILGDTTNTIDTKSAQIGATMDMGDNRINTSPLFDILSKYYDSTDPEGKWVQHLEQKLNDDEWMRNVEQKIHNASDILNDNDIKNIQNLLHKAVDYLIIYTYERKYEKFVSNHNPPMAMASPWTSRKLDINKCKQIIDVLLSCKAININCTETQPKYDGESKYDGETVLIKASRSAQNRLIYWLLKQNELLKHDDPLIKNWLLDKLLKRDDIQINAKTEYGHTALMLACMKGNTEVVGKLLTAMHNKQLDVQHQLNLKDDDTGSTALIFASQQEDTAVLDTLFTACPDIKLDAQDFYGNTALIQACTRGYIKTVQKLIKQSNAIYQAHYAEVKTHLIPDMANIVASYCKDTEMLNKTDRKGRGALSLTVEIFKNALSKTDEKRKHTYATIIQTLMDAGAESDWFKADEVLYPQYLQIMHLNNKDDGDDDHTEVADIAVAATSNAGAVAGRDRGLDD